MASASSDSPGRNQRRPPSTPSTAQVRRRLLHSPEGHAADLIRHVAPLDLARAGDAEALQAALASLAPRATKDFFAEKPLHVAAEEGHEEIVKMLILGGADVNGKNEKGSTPLHSQPRRSRGGGRGAHRQGRRCERKKNGGTPLHSAAFNGHRAMVEMLIGKGAEPNAKADKGKPNPGMIKPLDSQGYQESAVTPLHLAAFNGHTAMVEMLIGKGAEPNAKTDGGWTPLHLAAHQGHEAAAEELIVKGADVNAKDEDGHKWMVMLQGKGAKPNAKADVGKPNSGMVKTRLAKVSGIDGSNDLPSPYFLSHIPLPAPFPLSLSFHPPPFSFSHAPLPSPFPLFLNCLWPQAPYCPGRDNVSFVIESAKVGRKPSNELKNILRNTALHIAASQGHLHVLFTLVKLGAATNVRNGRGETPKELLKGTSTTANYDMEIFNGISLIEIMEKYLAAEKGKASLRREYMSFQNEHKKELKSIKEDQRKRDADSQTMKKEIGALKDKIKAIEEEHKAELRNVAENQQEKEAEILRMQNEIVGLKETVASRDEKIKSLERDEHETRIKLVTDQLPCMRGSANGRCGSVGRERRSDAPGTPVRGRGCQMVPAQDTDRGPFQERRQEERRGRETQAAGENKEQDTVVSALQDTIKLLQEQSTKELLSLRNAQHLKEAEAASQLREAQEALKSRDKRVKTLKSQEKKKWQLNLGLDSDIKRVSSSRADGCFSAPGRACAWATRRSRKQGAVLTGSEEEEVSASSRHQRSSQAESRGRNRASGPEEGRKSKDPQATKRTKTPQADTLRESPQAVTSQAEAGRRGKRRPIERPEAPQAQSEDETPEGGSECESCASSQAESDDASP
ncbi:putative serine/threonine-protein phosphatase 6 regulatory ankyrin repeat subunit A-like [Penaeus vannamei]|uniref:Putative serine/threonine-protein phosphatase 6 regulatory ankyrin repeat subunit A-like n=1 Tax=Penaeus vannamei TaxID=6689 RepID=A0A3R7PT44_PENVA|nr:putative serine/threonine-protein phosphatase 6 regulatory ankyrin repeat subunit A-like [Penaeus vannamei]